MAYNDHIDMLGGCAQMALFDREKERQRKLSLKLLEDKRLAFAEQMQKQRVSIECALLALVDGGFRGLAISNERPYLLIGPGPLDEDVPFEMLDLTGAQMRFDPFIIPSDGMGGMLGFGKKGGRGYQLMIEPKDGEPISIQFVPALAGVLEVPNGAHFGLLNTKRRRGDSNFAWDFSFIEPHKMDEIVQRWSPRIK